MFKCSLYKKYAELPPEAKSELNQSYLICIVIVLIYLYVITYLNMENYGYELTDYDVIGRSILFGEQKYDVVNNIIKILFSAAVLTYLVK